MTSDQKKNGHRLRFCSRFTVHCSLVLFICAVFGWAQTRTAVLEIRTRTLPDCTAGKQCRLELEVRGGKAPHRWSVIGNLHPGFSIDPTTGVISGNTTEASTREVTVKVTDSNVPQQAATQDYRIRVVQPLQMLTGSLPPATGTQAYQFYLRVIGGVPPYRFDVASGALPPGIGLDPVTGQLAGRATQIGEFSFTVRVTDSGTPRQTLMFPFIHMVSGNIAMNWIDAPKLRDGGIFGSVRVTNATRTDFDLTVIIVAVNEIGKAFTLGYRHFTLARQTESADLPFGFGAMPRGTYTVHADAVAEVPAVTQIYRTRLQSSPLKIEQ